MFTNETNLQDRTGRYPPIVLSVSDHRRLQRIALETLLSDPRNAGALLDEIDRADIVEDALVDERVVRLGDLVKYRDGLTGEQHLAQLVGDLVDTSDEAALSVRSSSGAALIGLRVGQSILWADRLGTEQVYTILSVSRDGTTGAPQ
jgi:regulator of nucleoside diphosphate kinase